MNTPVSFEIAKLLKEKGWSIPTLNFYFEDGESKENVLKETTGMDYGSEFIIEFSELIENWNDKWLTKKNGDRCFGCSKSKGYFETFSAPTIAEVVMWLYEKHGIWISVIDVSPSHILWEYQISRKEVGLIYSSGQYPVKHNYSPTEAYEAAIKHCLEKII